MRRLVVLATLACVAAGACGSTVQMRAGAPMSDEFGAPTSDATSATTVGGASTAGTALPAAAQSQGATAARSAGASAAASPRGTAPIQVGFLVTKDLGPAAKALGAEGLATGSGAQQARATAGLINASGGVAGRRVVPVIFEQDATRDASSQTQAACSLFFDDNHVVAVVAWGVIPIAMECAKRHQAPFVTSGNRPPTRRILEQFPQAAVPSQMPVETVIATQVRSLKEQGWLRPGVKIGLLYSDSADFASVPAEVERVLRAGGFALTEAYVMPVTDDVSRAGSASAAGSNAVLRFRAKGIDRVLTVSKSGQALAYFGIAAQAQSYYPLYGISSMELPTLLRTVLSARQLEGAVGIGFAPFWDLRPGTQPAPRRNEQRCLAAMTAAGEDMSVPGTRASALTICDGGLALAALWRNGNVTATGFVEGLRGLGTTYEPVMTFASDFGRGAAPASQYRNLGFAKECDCFRYTSALTNVAS